MIEGYSGFLDIFSNMISAIIAIEYIHCGFTKKYEGTKRFLLLLAGCLLYFGVIIFLYERSEFECLTGIFYGLALLLYAQVALNGSFREKVLLSMIWVIIVLISSYMVLGIVGYFTSRSLVVLFSNLGKSRIYVLIAAAIVKFSLGRTILAAKQRKGKNSDQMEDWAMAGAFLMVFILTIGMFRLEEGHLEQQSRNNLSLFLLAGVCGIIFLLGYMYRKSIQHNEECLKMQYQLMNEEEQKRHMKYMQEIQNEIRKMRHDQLGKLEILYRLVKKGKQEEILSYIEEMNQKLKDYQELPQDTGNDGLDAALLHAIEESRKEGIHFSYRIQKITYEIDDMDMGNLFRNLLSNALEACKKVEGRREIELEIEEINGRFYCKLENNIKESVLQINPKLQTNKVDKNMHGFGMQSIYEIINKYNGDYDVFEEENVFVQEIYLTLK